MRHEGMRWVKWTIIVVLVVVLGGLLHYTLPRHQVVRIVGVETRLETFGINRFFYANAPWGTSDSDSRDVRYIETVRRNGVERVFRNEDTGWGWPPYFKFDSSDMQARARDQVSTSDQPIWLAVTYYGVRSNLFSTYPNIVRVRPIEDPDATIIPWSRIIGLIALAALAGWVYVVLRRFRTRRLEPFIDRMDDRTADARGWLGRQWDRLRGR